MIEIQKALELITENCRTMPKIELPVHECLGYVCAEDLYAKLDMPPFDKSSMDGYAFKWQDSKIEYINDGIIAAGDSFDEPIEEGHCIAIMTGAPLPFGADTVIPVEITEKAGDKIRFTYPAKKCANVSYKAEDIKKDALIFPKGKIIRTQDIALIVASGYSKVKVSSLPEIAILNTGSEIIEPGEPLDYGQIYNSNGTMLSIMAQNIGINAEYLGIAADDEKSLKTMLSIGLKSDILLISGGVSMGEFDLVPKVLLDLGVKQIFHKVRIKPGKPVFFGKTDKCLVFGLPGNPLSNFVGFELFVKTAVRKMTGSEIVLPVFSEGIISSQFKHRADRKNFYPAAHKNNDGKIIVTPVISHGSADISSLSKSNCFMIADIDKLEYSPGDKIQFLEV
ncbi:MAG TPA: molybdopterin molybdotransferase MoeA [Clostridiales bacterium]|nr:molybdopterin molybdotransferase MoeA [Clostridiales bacterium]HQP68806.1 molybdopterin molybdotransferase MoeA [Clostridiales bacterium]